MLHYVSMTDSIALKLSAKQALNVNSQIFHQREKLNASHL